MSHHDRTLVDFSVLFVLKDPAASSTTEADSDTREDETVAMNYKPSPLQVKIGRCLSAIELLSIRETIP